MGARQHAAPHKLPGSNPCLTGSARALLHTRHNAHSIVPASLFPTLHTWPCLTTASLPPPLPQVLGRKLYRFLRRAFAQWQPGSSTSLTPIIKLWLCVLAPWKTPSWQEGVAARLSAGAHPHLAAGTQAAAAAASSLSRCACEGGGYSVAQIHFQCSASLPARTFEHTKALAPPVWPGSAWLLLSPSTRQTCRPPSHPFPWPPCAAGGAASWHTTCRGCSTRVMAARAVRPLR